MLSRRIATLVRRSRAVPIPETQSVHSIFYSLEPELGISRIKYYSIDYLNKKLFFVDLFLILLLIFIFIDYFNLYYYSL
jgi:hypothetical protein